MVLTTAVESRVMKRRDSSREVNFAADLNGGSDLIYIPDGDKSVAKALAAASPSVPAGSVLGTLRFERCEPSS
jgi:hypothetical protein